LHDVMDGARADAVPVRELVERLADFRLDLPLVLGDRLQPVVRVFLALRFELASPFGGEGKLDAHGDSTADGFAGLRGNGRPGAAFCTTEMAQPSMSTDLIRNAVRNRTCLTAVYDNYVRYFCPYAVGRTAERVPAVLAFQYE